MWQSSYLYMLIKQYTDYKINHTTQNNFIQGKYNISYIYIYIYIYIYLIVLIYKLYMKTYNKQIIE
jgi:hypothetical protein